ncbi:MAG TPA: glucan biosynthesis protein G [Nevskiaceae bacterium]
MRPSFVQASIAAAMLLFAAAGTAMPSAAQAFDFNDVTKIAKQLAQKPYAPPPGIPEALAKLDYRQYLQIHALPQNSLWEQSHTDFQVTLTPPGEYYRHLVKIDVVDANGTHAVPFHKHWFQWPNDLADKLSGNLGYTGFKLTFPLNGPGKHDQFLVFAGASYFRGVARNQVFGLSGRGIAVDTGLPSGEQFPNFTHFWLVRPSPDAHVMQFYALLNGASLTGAYHFTVFPGAKTRLEVHARLFMRHPVQLLGLAPLTSMFYYGANTPRPVSEWRPAAHDSGGLLIHSGTGEWLWRPLINPIRLQMNYFVADSPRGFGLLQRATRFSDYEDDELDYQDRPSAWITPRGDWGSGHVVLVEIPTDSETNDNIVAFWSPDSKAHPASGYDLRYTLDFGAPDVTGETLGQVRATYVGTGPATGRTKAKSAYRIAVDFGDGELAKLKPDADVQGVVTGLDGTTVQSQSVRWVAPSKHWRLSIDATPANGKPLALRAFLKQGADTLTETWSYALPPDNRYTAGG